MFRFLVEPAANGLKDLIGRSLSEFTTLSENDQAEKIMEYSDKGFAETVPLIYEHFDEFKLLVTGAPGNYYQDFLESLVELDTACMKSFLVRIGSKAIDVVSFANFTAWILYSMSYFRCFFAIVVASLILFDYTSNP